MSDSQKVKRHLLRSAGVVSAMTFLSRILGMVRDIVNAHVFGISRVWDAFVFAFMIPNFLRRLLGEGALSGAFIPLYAEIFNTNGEKEANAFTNIILSLLLVGLGTVLMIVNMVIALILAFTHLPQKVVIILSLLQLFSPYILILCILAVAMGVLNCHKRFFVPSLMPIILNIGWIATLYFVCMRFGSNNVERIYMLGSGIFSVSIIQFVAQFFALYRTGFRFRFNLNLQHPYMSKLITLMLPAILGFSVTQINILIDLFLAFLIGDGANSALWYGNRVMQFPLGMFGIAMGTVLLPTISHQAAQNNLPQMKETLSFSLRSVLLIIMPSTVGLVLLSTPITSLLFESGLFDALATQKAASTLMAYSFGLFAYSGVKLLLPSFYSLQDTRTPVKIGVICMFLNIVLNLILMIPLREMGIALSTSITNTLNFFILFMLLEKKIGTIGSIMKPVIKIILASIAMGIIVFYAHRYVNFEFFTWSKLNLLSELTVVITIAVVTYILFCIVFRVHELTKAITFIFKWVWGKVQE